MGTRVIATDLDGTLFYPRHKYSLFSKKYVRFLQEQIDKGNKVVLVTGRSYKFCKKVEKKLKRSVDLVCCNGAYIRVNGEVIQNIGLGDNIYDVYRDIENKYSLSSTMAMCEEDDHLIVYSRHHYFTAKLFMILYSIYMGNYAEKYKIVNAKYEDNLLKNGKVYKFMLLFGVSKKTQPIAIEAVDYINKTYTGVVAASSDQFVEITPRDCMKSNGLAKIRDYYGLTNDDFYVIGDSGNDIPMFKAFYDNSFCMKHADEHVRCHAKHTISRIYEVADYLK